MKKKGKIVKKIEKQVVEIIGCFAEFERKTGRVNIYAHSKVVSLTGDNRDRMGCMCIDVAKDHILFTTNGMLVFQVPKKNCRII